MNPGFQLGDVVSVVSERPLGDDLPAVERRIDIVDRHTEDLDAVFQRLFDGMRPAECRQQRRVDVDSKVVQIWKITATAGLVVFPISYIINDCIAEVWGFRKARLIIWMGFAMNFMVVALGQLAILMPAAPFWEGEEGFNFVFGMAPRIAVASLTAFLVGSFLNAYVMSKMKLASGGKNFSLRAITSTLVGESADSMIFFPVAFGGLMPAGELIKMMVIQAVLKTLYEIIILPVTIRVVNYIKKVDGSDVFDEHISYNVLKIKEL